MAIRADRLIGRLLDFVEAKVGPGNTLVVLTADHGVAPLPGIPEHAKMPGGRLSSKVILGAIEAALKKSFGDGPWVAGGSGEAPYLNRGLIRTRKLSEAEVERVAAEAVAAIPHVFRVYTRAQLLNGAAIDDQITRRVVNGYYPSRSSDLVVLEEAYWIPLARGSSHGSAFGYDTHVPVIFMGPNIRAGRYDRNILPNDIAPTLATMLEVETPSGAAGRVLAEMLSGGSACPTGH